MTFEPLLSPFEAASLLGVHEKTLIKLARIRQVPAIRLGRLWKFRASALDSWVSAQAQSVRQSAMSAQEII
jgi:excisionase family DNA binding protein